MGSSSLVIIGNGDIAKALKAIDRDDRIYFVSGVSNSSETRESEFTREKKLLFSLRESKHIVYVSSLSVFYSNTPYARHKRVMEQCVQTWAYTRHEPQNYTIIRVGNITWGNNPHTLINHFRGQKDRGEALEIQDTFRYVIDKDEFVDWMQMIPKWSCEMNIPGRRLKVAEIVDRYVEAFELEAVA